MSLEVLYNRKNTTVWCQGERRRVHPWRRYYQHDLCQQVNGKDGHYDDRNGDRLVIFECQCKCHKEHRYE